MIFWKEFIWSESRRWTDAGINISVWKSLSDLKFDRESNRNKFKSMQKKWSRRMDHGASDGDGASTEKTRTREPSEGSRMGLYCKCVLSRYFFLYQPFRFLRERQKLITCRAQNIWTQRVTEVIIAVRTNTAGLLPSFHSLQRPALLSVNGCRL